MLERFPFKLGPYTFTLIWQPMGKATGAEASCSCIEGACLAYFCGQGHSETTLENLTNVRKTRKLVNHYLWFIPTKKTTTYLLSRLSLDYRPLVAPRSLTFDAKFIGVSFTKFAFYTRELSSLSLLMWKYIL